DHFSISMFVTMAMISAPIFILTWQRPADVFVCYANPGVVVLSAPIILFGTVIAFVFMNKWQRFVPATEAAIIYGAEPVFASILALFLPEIISKFADIRYANERVTWQLLAGGGLVVGANVLLQLRWKRPD